MRPLQDRNNHTGDRTRILCDAEVSRIVVAGDPVPLDWAEGYAPPPPHNAARYLSETAGVFARDVTGPPEWTDVHHKTHWIDGGRTDLDDLELLCRPHHIEEHEKDPGDRGPPSRR